MKSLTLTTLSHQQGVVGKGEREFESFGNYKCSHCDNVEDRRNRGQGGLSRGKAWQIEAVMLKVLALK